jgi:RimJ/RimL family protein N-acetyltransferase
MTHIFLDTLSEVHQRTIISWRNELKEYCREYRDISPDHQERWWEDYKAQAYAPNPKTLLWGIFLATGATSDASGKHYSVGSSFIGVGGWTYINWHDRRAELSYYLDPAAQGKGYGREALRLLIEKARVELGMHTLYGEVHDYNEASLKCMKACGFTEVGRYKDAAFKRGGYCDVLLLELAL